MVSTKGRARTLGKKCLRNLRIVRREQQLPPRRLAGALGALAACFLLAPVRSVESGSPALARARDVAWCGRRRRFRPRAEAAPAPAESSSVCLRAPGVRRNQFRRLVCQTRKTRVWQRPRPIPVWTDRPCEHPGPQRPRLRDAPRARRRRAASQSGSESVEFSMGGSGQTLVRLVPGMASELRRFKRAADEEFNTEAYDGIQENRFRDARDNPLSTFSIDVDTASYSNVRRFLRSDRAPAFRSSAHRGVDQLFFL